MDRVKYEVLEDCHCEESLHERLSYPRPGIKLLKLKAGDIVTFVEEFKNLYGKFIYVEKDKVKYCIKPFYLKLLPNE